MRAQSPGGHTANERLNVQIAGLLFCPESGHTITKILRLKAGAIHGKVEVPEAINEVKCIELGKSLCRGADRSV